MTWAVNEGNVADKDEVNITLLTGDYVWLGRVKGLEAVRRWAGRALVKLGIGVAQLNRDVSQLFTEETHCLYKDKRGKG